MNRRHGQHTAIMVRNSHPYHPECTSAAWTPATFLRHPATGHGAGRRTGSTPTARHVGPRSTTPGQPAPSFAGTSRRQDPATLKAAVTRQGVPFKVLHLGQWGTRAPLPEGAHAGLD